jgi:hypothetical protein
LKSDRIEYLNTDLELRSAENLLPLADALKAAGFFSLHIGQHDDGTWAATLETEESFTEPEASITRMLDALDLLLPEHKAVWSRCAVKEFDIGYVCGSEPWAFNQSLSNAALARITALNASLRWTLYPPMLSTEPAPGAAVPPPPLPT